MSETITVSIEGRRVKLDKSFLSLSEDEQNATIEEISQSFGPRQTLMGNVNKGIAEGAGGLVDLFNPFDGDEFGQFSTGSAASGLENVMNAGGVDTAQGAPDGFLNSFARGAGNAASIAPFAGVGVNALAKAPGIVGNIARDAGTAINSARGVGSEMLAGGGSEFSGEVAKDLGAGPTGQMIAQIAGGGVMGMTPEVLDILPTPKLLKRAKNATLSSIAPFTKAGAREIVKSRFKGLAGGEDRARELGQMIPEGPTGEINLTPAQMTGDANMLGIEQQAARVDPALRARLEARADASRGTAGDNIGSMGGDATDAQDFFTRRRLAAKEVINGYIQRAASKDLSSRPSPMRSEGENSVIVKEQILSAEAAALAQEKVYWGAVPKDVKVGTVNTRQAAMELINSTPKPSQKHIPDDVFTFLGDGKKAFGDFESVDDMHALYSELRKTAREAMARPVPNKRQASMANQIAAKILDDLGAGGGGSTVGDAIDKARAFSLEMHNTFDRGAVGDILKRSNSGGDKLEPEMALNTAMGAGGTKAALGQRSVRDAAPTAETAGAVEDYLRGRFANTAFPEGEFKSGPGRTFMRNNDPALSESTGLRDDLENSLDLAENAQRAKTRGTAANADANNPSKSARAAFEQSPSTTAAAAVFKSKSPNRTAIELSRTARKDKTGEAMAGLRGSFLDYLTSQTSLNGGKIDKFLAVPENANAFKAVFKPGEMRRLKAISAEINKLDAAGRAAPDIGELSNSPPQRMIEMAVRVMGANQGAKLGEGGASIQTASFGASAANKLLGKLQNNRAESLMMDAVEDPELFRALLMSPAALGKDTAAMRSLAPYFTGTVAATAEDQNAQ